jgi:hypothetical protein
MKAELGLDYYKGRKWMSFHHKGVLYIAAYAFLKPGEPPPKVPSEGRSPCELNAAWAHPSRQCESKRIAVLRIAYAVARDAGAG